MTHRARLIAFAACCAALSPLAACNSDTVTRTVTETDSVFDTVTIRDTLRFGEFRVFNQIERLGNPLVSEVTLEKRDHGFHNVGSPSTDRANFKPKVVKFITMTAGRSPATANALADALLPDMLIAHTARAANTAGWLSYVLNPNAYGGRKLADDVVDIGLMAIFGPLVDPNNVTPGLTTDNVPPFGGGPAPTGTFPYLANPNQ